MIYITYYTTEDDKRFSSPAANAKAISISKALVRNGIKVNILSTCTTAKNGKFIKGRKVKVGDNIECKQYALYNTKIGIFRRFQYYLANFRVFLELIYKAKKNDIVIFYHAIERSFPIIWAKKVKKFHLILEVEEIYGDALNLSDKYKKAEMQCIRSADAYIFPTEMLNIQLNKQNKPYCIIHGTYESEPILEKKQNDCIHVIYAGTLDPLKGGAIAAVEAAKFLSERYHVHILGFGNENLVNQIRMETEKVSRMSTCKVTYDGFLTGDEYKHFIQKCHIGLSTQNPNAKFNDTSFPSKILSYMANGLRVVSIRIPVVETSAIDQYMTYYDEQTPSQIAEAIKLVKFEEYYDSRQIVNELNYKFVEQINSLLAEVNDGKF